MTKNDDISRIVDKAILLLEQSDETTIAATEILLDTMLKAKDSSAKNKAERQTFSSRPKIRISGNTVYIFDVDEEF